MKVQRAYSGEETVFLWTEAIKQLFHRYLKHRNKRRALQRVWAENKIMAPYEGRRWCDATERELVGHITKSYRSLF